MFSTIFSLLFILINLTSISKTSASQKKENLDVFNSNQVTMKRLCKRIDEYLNVLNHFLPEWWKLLMKNEEFKSAVERKYVDLNLKSKFVVFQAWKDVIIGITKHKDISQLKKPREDVYFFVCLNAFQTYKIIQIISSDYDLLDPENRSKIIQKLKNITDLLFFDDKELPSFAPNESNMKKYIKKQLFSNDLHLKSYSGTIKTKICPTYDELKLYKNPKIQNATYLSFANINCENYNTNKISTSTKVSPTTITGPILCVLLVLIFLAYCLKKFFKRKY